jgi:hypothetical protein
MPLTQRIVVALSLGTLISCSEPSETNPVDCEDGKCDIVDSPCDKQGLIEDLSGSTATPVAGRLHDKFAKLVMQTGDTCPTSLQDIMTKLKEQVAAASVDECGETFQRELSTRVISETAQLTGMPARAYRLVTTQACNTTDAVILSMFAAPGAPLQPNAEIISFDDSAGVFNYYDATGDRIEFFGSSKDLLKGSPDGNTRRCAQCHTGGGLIMKELDTPWIHWEGHLDHPGAKELVEANADLLGRKNTGAEFEFVVKDGNQRWNQTRLTHLTTSQSRSVKELLRPLFCTVEINLDNGADFERPKDQIKDIPFDSLLDPQVMGQNQMFGGIPIMTADYDAQITMNGQRIQNRAGQQVAGKVDTIFDYTFVERSAADNDFVIKLRDARIIDTNFIKDVLMVDFTRPIFSKDRCDLLDQFAPEFPADLNPETIRDGFIAKLEAAKPAMGTPAAALLANLKNSNDGTAHTTKVNDFVTACTNLGSAALVKNALAIAALNRNEARKRPIMEFAEAMPFDNQKVDANARLHPATCELVNSFVP